MGDPQVVLVEDRAILRQGLRAMLSREPNLEVVGEEGTASTAFP
jgi:two-component system, NarL family, response regulator DevR